MGEGGEYSKQCETMKPGLILVGGGGHCKSCIDVIEQADVYRIAGIVDTKEKLHQKVLGYEVVATDDDLPRLVKKYELLITVGQIKSPALRIRLFASIKEFGGRLPVIVSPLAYVSEYAGLGEGTIVMHHALVNAGAVIGSNCIINTKALVEHDAVIHDHCHIATGGIVNGGTVVHAGTFIGSGAVSSEYIEIGENTVVGSNLAVKNNVPPGEVIS